MNINMNKWPLTIKQILSTSHQQLPKPIQVSGWVNNYRNQKNTAFISLSDGSSLNDLQIVINQSQLISDEITKGSCLQINGTLIPSPSKGQSIELDAKDIQILGKCPSDQYPLLKSRVSFDYLRDYIHLRSKTKTFGALWRIRNIATQGIHEYFIKKQFIQIHTPILTSNDCEGGGEAFQLKDSEFFNQPAYLTVSGQLHLEMLAASHSRVYTLNPAFRAEPSKSTRHLAEFWMLEAEMAFINSLDQLTSLIQDMIQSLTLYIYEHAEQDLEFCHEFIDKSAKERSQLLLKPFKTLSYTDAVHALSKVKKAWEYPIKWGLPLQAEHERYLAKEYCQSPVFVTEYPINQKPFYMKASPGLTTVECTDLLLPKLGELVGGSLRENSYDILNQRMSEAGLDKELYDWYLDLRRFGSFPHGGFGMGFERYLAYITGMSNIKDWMIAPRFMGHCKY